MVMSDVFDGFQRETLAGAFSDLMPLLEEHYREIAHYQDIELDVDLEGYIRVENAGMLRLFTCRRQKELVGYAAFFVKPNLHYQKSLQAVQDVVFISKEHRGFGRDFIRWCDEQLKLEGVQVVYHHVKSKHNWGRMLEGMGYELVDLIYAKRLDE
jgi:hypothetical protein